MKEKFLGVTYSQLSLDILQRELNRSTSAGEISPVMLHCKLVPFTHLQLGLCPVKYIMNIWYPIGTIRKLRAKACMYWYRPHVPIFSMISSIDAGTDSIFSVLQVWFDTSSLIKTPLLFGVHPKHSLSLSDFIFRVMCILGLYSRKMLASALKLIK